MMCIEYKINYRLSNEEENISRKMVEIIIFTYTQKKMGENCVKVGTV